MRAYPLRFIIPFKCEDFIEDWTEEEWLELSNSIYSGFEDLEMSIILPNGTERMITVTPIDHPVQIEKGFITTSINRREV